MAWKLTGEPETSAGATGGQRSAVAFDTEGASSRGERWSTPLLVSMTIVRCLVREDRYRR